MSASLFDFGLVVFNNAREQLERGTGPVLLSAEARVARGGPALGARVRAGGGRSSGCRTARSSARCLIETILAAFEMDAILYELRDHSCALNAGRWDYIFSCIKKLGAVLPDRAQVTMTVPFMRAYSELLVKTCHERGGARDRRHGGVHPVAARRGGERDRAREGERGQAARGRRRLRRHLGRASRPRAGRAGRVRRGARRAPEPGRAQTRRRSRERGAAASTSRSPAARSPTRACA